ncbi:unnamed protein product [Cuscuta campestris]|uniref:mannan endo-1,4-beta-mannosidase n=1 Tax=Cuscuta campestris TaxID=132261 RepID=A0A484KC10_9ASTE|nr:unnamed protein product [Cuscuta campestris]
MVKINGTQMRLNGSPFYWNGFNAYWLMVMAAYDDPTKVRTVFEQARSHGLTVARTWAFSDGGDLPLQISPGVYNETMFQALDYVMSEAGNQSIKLVLSLVNNWGPYGGKQQYVNWVHPNNSTADLFFNDSRVKQLYQNHIKAVLTRNNSISGVMYKDDPTIMAWELINEPRCQSDLSGSTFQDWIKEMAAFLKGIDKKHLLEIGLEGFYGKADDAKNQAGANGTFQYGTDFISNNQIPDIDFATVHVYPDDWLNGTDEATKLSFLRNWTKVHIEDAQKILGKPIVVAEFGKDRKDPGYTVEKRNEVFATVYDAIYDSAKGGGAAAGGMFWQLFTERMDSYGDGNEIIFSRDASTTGAIIDQQSERMGKLRLGVGGSKGYNGKNEGGDGGMVRVNGTQMVLDNGSPFYWNGFNAYWLMVMAAYDDPTKVSAVFEQARSHGLTVARALAFSDGGDFPLQSSPGVYNEKTFQGLDFVISEARKYGIKLILSLVNNYPDFGGKQQYVNWVHPHTNSPPDLFFTDPQVKQYYMNHVKVCILFIPTTALFGNSVRD